MVVKKVKNFTKGRGEHRPEMICIHLADGTAESVFQEFSGDTDKSSHYLVCKNGEIWQFVDENDTAWTQGLKVKVTAKFVLARPTLNQIYIPNRRKAVATWIIGL